METLLFNSDISLNNRMLGLACLYLGQEEEMDREWGGDGREVDIKVNIR